MARVREPFAGRVAVVTGASGSIGRSICRGLSSDGATLVGIGRRKNMLEATAATCPGPMTPICADLSRTDECFGAIEHVVATYGRIDILVNAQGVAPVGMFVEQPFEDWANAVGVNVVGVAACCRAALPHMIRQDYGRIINLSSRMAGAIGERTSAYSASKAAATILTACLASEVTKRHPNVIVNDLIPGPTRTESSPRGQSPEAVYPFVRKLALLPSGGPSGRVFYRGKLYSFRGLRQLLFRFGRFAS